MIAWLVFASCAVWRLTSILMYEDMCARFRHWLGIVKDEATGAQSYPDNLIGDVFGCFWCLSLIVACLFCGLVWAFTNLTLFQSAALWPAASAGAIMIERYFFARYRE